MTFTISPKSGIPIYVQLQNQIKDLVLRGVWAQGHRLPTERELAEQLGISRNTVSTAYKQLEAQRVICRKQGSGTFVCATPDSLAVDSDHKDRVLRLVDLAIGEALQLGFSIEDFTAIVTLRVRQRKEMLGRLQVAFVECNREQLDYFTKELELGSGVTIHPWLLQNLQGGAAENLQRLRQMDMVVTTFYHLDEVKAMLGSEAPQPLGIALEPSVSSIVRIARVAPDSLLPVVCLSQTFAQSIITALEQADLIFKARPKLQPVIRCSWPKPTEPLRLFLRRRKRCSASRGSRTEITSSCFNWMLAPQPAEGGIAGIKNWPRPVRGLVIWRQMTSDGKNGISYGRVSSVYRTKSWFFLGPVRTVTRVV